MYLYLVAGEASGDALGAGLMKALREQEPSVTFSGIGGERMQQEGLQSLFPYQELSIMGFLEVLPHIPHILRRLKETAADIAARKPDAVITIDSPGFNFRLAKLLRQNPQTQFVTRIHYVAPSVWAYKPGRARKTAKLFDLLLALLPFEPPFFEKEGLRTICTGHPVLWQKNEGNAEAFRSGHGISANEKILLVLPGSRAGEVKWLLPIFLKAAQALPDYRMMVMASPQVKTLIQQSIKNDIKIVDSAQKQDAFAAATLALSKSGTITLELAAAHVPMVVAHKVSPLSAWLIRRMILIPYASLVNIAAKKLIVPELLQENCTVKNITLSLLQLTRPDIRRQQLEECAAAINLLRSGITQVPDRMAAQAVINCLSR